MTSDWNEDQKIEGALKLFDIKTSVKAYFDTSPHIRGMKREVMDFTCDHMDKIGECAADSPDEVFLKIRDEYVKGVQAIVTKHINGWSAEFLRKVEIQRASEQQLNGMDEAIKFVTAASERFDVYPP